MIPSGPGSSLAIRAPPDYDEVRNIGGLDEGHPGVGGPSASRPVWRTTSEWAATPVFFWPGGRARIVTHDPAGPHRRTGNRPGRLRVRGKTDRPCPPGGCRRAPWGDVW